MKEYIPHPQEAQITAYALGEMSAQESAEFEKTIAGNPAALAEVGGIRDVAALLQEGFGRELDAMFHPEGLVEPVPIFSVVDFEEEEGKVVPIDPFGRFSKPRAAVVALAAALVAAVAVVPMLREQSDSGMSLAGTAAVPVPALGIEGEPGSGEPLDKVVWNDSAAIRETLALTVPGAVGVVPVAAREESPVGFHLTGAASGSRAHLLSYIDPEILRMKSSIEAARRRIEMAESLLKMAETSSEAATILKELVGGEGRIGGTDAIEAESVFQSMLIASGEHLEKEKPFTSEPRGTVFRYGLRDEPVESASGFDIGPVWWQSETPAGESCQE